jgi:hypothetical protein
VSAALAVAERYGQTELPGIELLDEWPRMSRPPADRSFRLLRAADGWFALTLGRTSDVALVDALIGRTAGPDHWAAVSEWLQATPVAVAQERATLLGLPAAVVPLTPLRERRPPVVVSVGGPRSVVPKPLVIDLTAMWAGPLCARLLGVGGARVIKIESTSRADGARVGNPAMFEVLHRGHELRTLDFKTQRDELQRLLDRADVVLEASRPRALRQLGIDAAAYVRRGVVWVSITAYGRAPADELRVGFGNDVAAGAGLVRWVAGRPQPIGYALADPLAGVYAAAASFVALQARVGCLLDVSMRDVALRACEEPDPNR